MKKIFFPLLFLLVFLKTSATSNNIVIAAYGQTNTSIYKDGVLLATCSDSVAVCRDLIATQNNTTPVISGNLLQVGSNWVPLPKPANELVIATDSVAALAFHEGIDSLFFYQPGNGWTPVKAGFPAGSVLHQLEVFEKDNDVFVGAYFSASGISTIGYRNISGTSFGGINPPPPGTTSFKFLATNDFEIATGDDSIALKNVAIPIDSFDWENDSQSFCNGTWCLITERNKVSSVENTDDYLLYPTRISLDSSRYYSYYNHTSCAMNGTGLRFLSAIDKPVDVLVTPKMYGVSLLKQSEAINLGYGKQRLLVNRMIFPNDSTDQLWFGYGMNLAREGRDRNFEFVCARSGGPSGYLCRQDPQGQHLDYWHIPYADSHDMCQYDNYLVGIGHYQLDSGYWQPPVVIKKGTGQQWTVVPGSSNFPALGFDTCITLNSPGSNTQDRDHTNSVCMFYVPGKNKHEILKSSRHAAPWPLGAPLSALEFSESTGIVLDNELTALMNETVFGYKRSGGHDLWPEWQLTNETSNSFTLSQYDNGVCDSFMNPSWAHIAKFTYISGHWQVSDLRKFEGPPSTSQGSVSVSIYNQDTLVGINGGGINRYWGILLDQPLTIRDYSTNAKVAGFSFDNGGAGAYQSNLVSQLFEVPGFRAHLEDVGDSVRLLFDSVPAGTWWLWLSESKAVEPGSQYTFNKGVLDSVGGGLITFISGQYSAADTFPNMSASWIPNRWVSNPILLKLESQTNIGNHLTPEVILNLFPNPATSRVCIKTKGIGTLLLSTITGQILEQKKIDSITTIETQSLVPGIYIVTFINTDGAKATKKLIKL